MEAFDALSEALSYHDTDSFGFFSILHADGTTKKQRSYLLSAMPEVLQTLDGSHDTWISQATFTRPNRRAVNVFNVGLLFCDLDTYNLPGGEGLPPEWFANMVLQVCDEEGIPPPSFMVFSGRGLQAKWLLDKPLPRQALPRWNACERYLVHFLQRAGADPKAKDVSRVLRVVGTLNSKSGETCRVVHVETDQAGQLLRYDFDYLCEYILPFSREELQEKRDERAKRQKPSLKSIKGGKKGHLKGFSGRTLAWHRLEDLRTLAELRGGIKEGERMQHLFWQINFLLLSGAVNSSTMYAEAAELARQIDPSWNYRSQELMTVYGKAISFEKGEKIEFGGKMYPPLYTPKNETLINLFQITPDEERHLQTIISHSMAAERHKDRQADRRRLSGAIPHNQSINRVKPWESLGICRSTWYKMGKPES